VRGAAWRGPYVVSALRICLLSATGGGLMWLWSDVSTTAQECATGRTGSAATTVMFGALVLLTPAGLGVYASRSRSQRREIVIAAMIGTLVALLVVGCAALAWWGSHGCMT